MVSANSTTGENAGRPADRPRGRKTVVGTVSSDTMQKTITVEVLRLERHGRYHKYIRRRSKFYAHDENGKARVGDLVRIEETRPLSKKKRWRLLEIVRPAKRTDEALQAETPGGSAS